MFRTHEQSIQITEQTLPSAGGQTAVETKYSMEGRVQVESHTEGY